MLDESKFSIPEKILELLKKDFRKGSTETEEGNQELVEVFSDLREILSFVEIHAGYLKAYFHNHNFREADKDLKRMIVVLETGLSAYRAFGREFGEAQVSLQDLVNVWEIMTEVSKPMGSEVSRSIKFTLTKENFGEAFEIYQHTKDRELRTALFEALLLKAENVEHFIYLGNLIETEQERSLVSKRYSEVANEDPELSARFAEFSLRKNSKARFN